MAKKVKLRVAPNTTLPREGGGVHRPGDEFEAERTDEVEQWLRLEYAEEVKTRRKKVERRDSKR